jgi:hypothetical protein
MTSFNHPHRYNAMVHPFTHLSVRAALWYQGEANCCQVGGSPNPQCTDWHYYGEYLQAMARDWRNSKRMGDFAFLPMMLPPSVAASDNPFGDSTGRPDLRISQQLAVPHSGGETDISGVPVTIDLGGSSAWGYDHPPNKNEMSRRLALQTVHAAYAVQGRIPNANGGSGGPDVASSLADPTALSNTGAPADSLWTGPVLESVAVDGKGTITVQFVGFTADGLAMKDVKAMNINMSGNSCKLCCAEAPPFEFRANSEWSRVARSDVVVGTSAITLTAGSAATKADAVRYAWSDYVDCVVINGDSLVLAPFLENLTSSSGPPKHIVASTINNDHDAKHPANVGAPLITSPPMGFNSWNFYHCNIDENIVKQMADFFVSTGMAAVNYTYINIDDCWCVFCHKQNSQMHL